MNSTTEANGECRKLREISGRATAPVPNQDPIGDDKGQSTAAITVTAGGVTATYPTALTAILALLETLPTEQLGGDRWCGIIRRLKQRRTVGLPGPDGEPGSHVVVSVRG